MKQSQERGKILGCSSWELNPNPLIFYGDEMRELLKKDDKWYSDITTKIWKELVKEHATALDIMAICGIILKGISVDMINGTKTPSVEHRVFLDFVVLYSEMENDVKVKE